MNVIFISLLILFFISSATCADQKRGAAVNGALYESYSYNCDSIKNASGRVVSSNSYYQCFPYILNLVQPTDLWVGETYYDVLSTEPPPGDGKTIVYLLNSTVEKFTITDSLDFHPEIQLTVDIAWHDDRLRWNSDVWSFRVYPVIMTPSQQIWAPNFRVKGTEQMTSIFDHYTFFDSKLWYNGNVTAKAAVRVSSLGQCVMELEKFPYDRALCCFELALKPQDHIVVNIDSYTIAWTNRNHSTWFVDKFKLELKKDSERNGLEICIESSRNTATLSSEIVIPAIVSGILVISGRMIGCKLKIQIYFTLFAIAVQLSIYHNLISSDKFCLTSSAKLPKLYHFYNFTILVNLICMLESVLIRLIMKRRLAALPPHGISSYSKKIGQFVFGKSTTDRNHQEMSNKVDAITIGRQQEWKTILAVVHLILSFISVLFYVVYTAIIIFIL